MTTKHDVTVYDRVPATATATAAVSVEQVERYLRRTGWSARWSDEKYRLTHWDNGDDRVWTEPSAERVSRAICAVAATEGRQPSEVLADIAKEPT